MARKVIWTDTAWSDLEGVAKYIERDSFHYAAAFVNEVRAAAKSLSTFAERGHIVPEIQDPTVREIIVRSYRLLYQIKEDNIFILGLIHGARDLKALWTP